MSIFFTCAIISSVIAAVLTFPILCQNLFLLIPGVAKYSAGDVLNRYVLLLIILTIWWMYSRLGLRNIGLGKLNASKLKIAALSMGAGCLVIISFYMAKVLLGHGYFDSTGLLRLGAAKTVLWYLLGAVTVGVVEEILFRGITLEVFRQDKSTVSLAIPLSAILFSAVHFIDFSYAANAMVGTYTGDGAFWSLDNLSKFILLFVLGILLAYARVRTNTLYAAIGLHAGFVFSLRLFGKLFKASPGYAASVFQPGGVDAILILGMILVAFTFVRLLPQERKQVIGWPLIRY